MLNFKLAVNNVTAWICNAIIIVMAVEQAIRIPSQHILIILLAIIGIYGIDKAKKCTESRIINATFEENISKMPQIAQLIMKVTGSAMVAEGVSKFISEAYPRNKEADWQEIKECHIKNGQYVVLVKSGAKFFLSVGVNIDGEWTLLKKGPHNVTDYDLVAVDVTSSEYIAKKMSE